MSTLSTLASINVAILLYFILIPISYAVGYVPTKKFKKEVRAYCIQQYNKYIPPPPQNTKKNKQNVLINFNNTPKKNSNWNTSFIKPNRNNNEQLDEYGDDGDDEYLDYYSNKSRENDRNERERLDMIQSMTNYNNRLNNNNNFSVVVIKENHEDEMKKIKETIALKQQSGIIGRGGIGKPSKTVKL
jgi:uncharacterized protein (UPF0333 family)